jgi:predicted phage baseplate assembly protein
LTLRELAGLRVRERTPVNLKLVQPATMVGGEDAETVEAAEARIPGVLRHRERAVTADDYRVLAAQTPGVDVARVEVLPRFVPRNRAFGVPGVVTVMVLPGTVDGGVGSAPNPRADQPLIEAVHAQLEPRRPLATELYVIGCEYVPLALSLAVGLRDDAPRDATLAAVRTALRRLLWPLSPGGFDGQGWALGRSVADRELEVEAARVNGVASVAGVNLFVRDGDAWVRLTGVGMQQLQLAPWQLPELMQVVVEVGNSAPERIDPPADSGGTRVAVPVITDLC